jgi:asparagine synthase (glutamine-hydrolysing)
MTHSREVRLPFLNHELVEFIFTLPSHFKIREGWTKWLLRQSMNSSCRQKQYGEKIKVGLNLHKKMDAKSKIAEMIREARKNW